MPVDRAAEHRALASKVWRQVFELFVRARGRRDPVLQRLRLSPNDAKTLCMLDAAVAKPMGALADACCTDASNATWVVDRLENRGFVERRTVAGDRRVKLVALTPRGVKTRNAIMQALHEPPLEMLALDRDDLVALGKVLGKIPLLADAAPPPPPPPQTDSTPVATRRPTSRPTSRPLRRPRRTIKQRT